MPKKESLTSHEDLKILHDGLIKAGTIGMKYWKGNVETIIKGGKLYNIVTPADLEIDEFLIGLLNKQFPNYGILTEETFKGEEELGESFFTVDSIDGTSFFQRGLWDWSISISRITKGQVTLSMVYCPPTNEMFYAKTSQGAFLNGQSITVSNTDNPKTSIIYISQDMVRVYGLADIEERLIKNSRVHWSIASSARALSKLAEGRIDAAILSPQHAWDITPLLLIKEAGGKVTNWKGEEKFDFSGNKTNWVLATNGILHEQFMQLLT